MTNPDESFDPPSDQRWNGQILFRPLRFEILADRTRDARIVLHIFADHRGSGENGFLMNGCAGSAAAKFVPCAAARRTSESFASSNNHRITLCAFKRRPIVLSICPRNLSGAGAVARTSKL